MSEPKTPAGRIADALRLFAERRRSSAGTCPSCDAARLSGSCDGYCRKCLRELIHDEASDTWSCPRCGVVPPDESGPDVKGTTEDPT